MRQRKNAETTGGTNQKNRSLKTCVGSGRTNRFYPEAEVIEPLSPMQATPEQLSLRGPPLLIPYFREPNVYPTDTPYRVAYGELNSWLLRTR